MVIHRFARFVRALSRCLVTGQHSRSPLLNTRTASTLAAGALTSVLLSTASIPAAAQTPTGPQTGLPITKLTAGIHVIRAEVANTDETRRIGLMLRKSLPDNNGMLFVFDEADMQCFWMRNTLVPLSIAFIADDGTIVNMADMAPQTDEPHCSEQPVRYALEMAQGWFDTHGVAAGQRLSGISQ
ncbi:hypothetical protein BOTU111921_27665 [Bordetella tumbae]|uniref:DUF192 domain-containing protein n=1 Tax=Bordetella tumbae TaxID=1649139 RepID=UPI0039F1405C